MKRLLTLSLLLFSFNGWASACSDMWNTENWESVTACADFIGVCTDTDANKSYEVDGFYRVGTNNFGTGGFLPDLNNIFRPDILISKLESDFNLNNWRIDAIFSYDSKVDDEGYLVHNPFKLNDGYCSLEVTTRKGSVPNLNDVTWCFSFDALDSCF